MARDAIYRERLLFAIRGLLLSHYAELNGHRGSSRKSSYAVDHTRVDTTMYTTIRPARLYIYVLTLVQWYSGTHKTLLIPGALINSPSAIIGFHRGLSQPPADLKKTTNKKNFSNIPKAAFRV